MTKRLDVIPTPRYLEGLPTEVRLSGSASVCIVVGDNPDPKIALAARLLKDEIEARAPGLHGRVFIGSAGEDSAIQIHLQNGPKGGPAERYLNLLDRQVLTEKDAEQAYVLRTVDEKTVVIAGSPQGVLYGVSTVQQLLRDDVGALVLPGVYVRDFPTVQYRTAAGWLLNGEANRWSYDRGQGLDAYETLVKRKLDQCLRYKINMVMFDGFGFGLKERFREYPSLMRRFNRYARERGIRLVFGGYGSGFGMSYQKGPLYEDAQYIGTTFYNREHYPDGPAYSCMGYPEDKVRKGVDAGALGTCRGNEELNRLKAKELEDFVRAVEPGALYIHGEDYGGFDTTQRFWLKRCPRCRERWPNDDAAALDGGAGSIGTGYARLLEAVNGVSDRESGYEAARDCTVILTSPLYSPSSPSSEDWSKALTHWQNAVRVLPECSNALVCFREVFPQKFGNVRWIDCINRALRDVNPKLGVWMYFLCGGDHWCNENPFVATPCLDGLFAGTSGLYNANGSAYQEPQQLFNVECGWNVDSANAHLGAQVCDDPYKVWFDLLSRESDPEKVFGEHGFVRRACESLYGEAAAPSMVKLYTDYMRLPEPESEAAAVQSADSSKVLEPVKKGSTEYLPMTFKKLFGTAIHWRHLALDSKTWGEEIKNERYRKQFEDLGITRADLHSRLKTYWELIGRISEKGNRHLADALAASPHPASREDLEFMLESGEVSVLIGQTMAKFHEAKRAIHRGEGHAGEGVDALRQSLALAEEVGTRLAQSFPSVSDPIGAEVGSVKKYVLHLEETLRMMVADNSAANKRQRDRASKTD